MRLQNGYALLSQEEEMKVQLLPASQDEYQQNTSSRLSGFTAWHW